MSNRTSLRGRLREDLERNLLVSSVAVGLAVVALVVLAAFGVPSVGLVGLAIAIVWFVPQSYEQYWPGSRSRGFRVGWTALMALLSTVTFLVADELTRPYIDQYVAAGVAFTVTVIARYGMAILAVGRRATA